MPYLTGYAGEYAGLTRLNLIHQVLRGLGSPVAVSGTDTASDYSRYPKDDIIAKLDEAQVRFVRVTDCLSAWAIIEAVANQMFYHLPSRCLKLTEAKWYDSLNHYNDLEIKPDMVSMKRVSSSWRTDAAGTCEYLFPAYTYGNIRQIGIYPKPASNGATFDGTSLGLVTGLTSATLNDITGQQKTGVNGSNVTTDNLGRDMVSLGVIVGMVLTNTTRGTSSTITSFESSGGYINNVMVTDPSSPADFLSGDSWAIVSSDIGVIVRMDGSEEYAMNSNLGEIQDITPQTGNFLIDFVMRPLSLTTDNQYPEIPQDYHSALVEYAIWKLGMSEYNGLVMKDRAAIAQATWQEQVDEYKNFASVNVRPENDIADRAGEIYE